MEIWIYIVLMLVAMLTEDEEFDRETIMAGMNADGEFGWDDLGDAVGMLGSELGDSVPEIVKGIGTVTVAKESGMLTSVGIDPSGDRDTLTNKLIDWAPWLLIGGGILYLATRRN